MASDGNGLFYLASSVAETITLIDSSGVVHRTIGPSVGADIKLSFRPLTRVPLHVDPSHRIYVLSGPDLLVLSPEGEVLNVGPDGQLPKSFELPSLCWVGSDGQGTIYISPDPEDKLTLFAALSPDGRRVRSFGNKLFPRYSALASPGTYVAMGRDGELCAVSSDFAAFFRYSNDGRFLGYAPLSLPAPLEDRIAEENVSLAQALANESSDGREGALSARLNEPVFLDARWLDPHTLLCLTNMSFLLWYDAESGRLLRSLNLWKDLGAEPLSPNMFVPGPDGAYIIAAEVGLSDRVHRVDVP